MANFKEALEYVKLNEGIGYSTYPETDQPTNTGITRSALADYLHVSISSISDDLIKSLTQDNISDIYRKLYWDKIMGDQIEDQGIATCIFDTCVNRGTKIGVIYTQRTCNMLGAALVADGIFGLYTLAAINMQHRPSFIKTFENLETAGYLAIVASHPEKERYLRGWMNRAKKLFTLIP